jgi:hypothetical protein
MHTLEYDPRDLLVLVDDPEAFVVFWLTHLSTFLRLCRLICRDSALAAAPVLELSSHFYFDLCRKQMGMGERKLCKFGTHLANHSPESFEQVVVALDRVMR